MSKQETVNTFTEGLVMDLNPITTPNNVLTNALNATLITYNGNEFVLQNDMGNGRVETAYLPAGYVPVGIKEYGGIIYVASYNPLTNKGQIGSFPSPERNISSDEVSQTKNPFLTAEDFGTNSSFKLVQRFKLFDDSIIIRSGDKFSILLNTEGDISKLKSFVSNCLNTDLDEYGKIKIKSPKNKLLTISVAVKDSNNNLRDITSNLKRFDEENKIIDISDLAYDTASNIGYYMQTWNGGTGDDAVDNYRESSRAVNTYNNKLFGELYIVAELNTIQAIDISVRGFRNISLEETVYEGEKVPSNGTLLIYDLDYKYNCPDGVYEEEYGKGFPEEDFNNKYISYYGSVNDFKDNEHDYSKLISGTEIIVTTENQNQYTNTTYMLPFTTEVEDALTYPRFDLSTSLYTTRNSAALLLENKTSGIVSYNATPCMTYTKLSGLNIQGSINIDLLGTGAVLLSEWRFYCSSDSLQLTWGLQAYPKEGETIEFVKFIFYDAISKKETKTLEIDDKRSFNGTFTNVIPFSDEEFEYGKLYLVKIQYKLSSNSDLSTIAWRWTLNTPLYNNLYYTAVDADFLSSNNVKEIENLNKVDFDYDHSSTAILLNSNTKDVVPSYNEGYEDNTFAKIIEATYNYKYSVVSNVSTKNAVNYPFKVGNGDVESWEYNGNVITSIGDSVYNGDYNTYSNRIKIQPPRLSNLESGSDGIKFTIVSQSELVGNKTDSLVSVTFPFVPAIRKDNWSSLFGYSYNDSFKKATSGLGIGVRKKSTGTDRNWSIAVKVDRNASPAICTYLYEIYYKKGDDHHEKLIGYWSEFQKQITDAFNGAQFIIVTNPGYDSNTEGFNVGGGDSYNFGLHGLKSYVVNKYQYLLWKDYSGEYRFSQKLASGSLSLELPGQLYNYFRNYYIYKGSSSTILIKSLDFNSYYYKEACPITISGIISATPKIVSYNSATVFTNDVVNYAKSLIEDSFWNNSYQKVLSFVLQPTSDDIEISSITNNGYNMDLQYTQLQSSLSAGYASAIFKENSDGNYEIVESTINKLESNSTYIYDEIGNRVNDAKFEVHNNDSGVPTIFASSSSKVLKSFYCNAGNYMRMDMADCPTFEDSEIFSGESIIK